MRPVVCAIDFSAGLTFTRPDVLEPTWLDTIRRRDIVKIWIVSQAKIKMSEVIIVHVFMRELYIKNIFDAINKLAVPALFETMFIELIIKSTNPSKRKNVPLHFLTLLILTLRVAQSKDQMSLERNKSEISQEDKNTPTTTEDAH